MSMWRLAVLASVVAALGRSQMIVNMTVERVPQPLALDVAWISAPGFAWAVDPISCGLPTSYRVRVTSTNGSVVWDSGIVSGAPSAPVRYAGSPLQFETDYAWTVSVTTSTGKQCSSSPSMFGTAPDPLAWAASAVWVGGNNQLRYNFSLPAGAITRARVFATGLGIFALYINGQRVGGGRDVLSPGWSTVPTARVLAHGWDVSPLLLPGQENVIAVRLGMGKYGYLQDFCAGGPQACQAVALRLNITQATVTNDVASSAAWLVAPAPITFDHLFDGETYNSSLDQPGWNAPGFTPLTPWAPCTIVQPNVSAITGWDSGIVVVEDRYPSSVTPGPGAPVVAGGQFVKSDSSPDIWWVANATSIRNHVDECSPCDSVPACNLYVIVAQSYIDSLTIGPNFTCAMLPAGNSSSYVFDLGRNMAGFCTVTLPPAPAGTVVALVHGEILTTSGAVDNTYGSSVPVRSCNPGQFNCADQLDMFVMAGTGHAETYTPTFTFHGFRYVAVFGWPSAQPPPALSALVCHVVSTDFAAVGGISTNSSTLNSIQAAITATQRSNMFSHPSDCPQREKRGWMGDAQVSVDQALRNFGAANLYLNWLRTMVESQDMGCADPSAAFETNPLRPDSYICCGNGNSFGCQPGRTPLNTTGSLPDVVPYERQPLGGWPGDWTWQCAAEVIPRAVLEATGDAAGVARVYPMLRAHLAFAAEAADASGLLEYGYYGDWLAPEPTSTAFVENFFYTLALQQAAQVAVAVGASGDAVAYTALSVLVQNAMVDAYFHADSGVWDSGNMNAQAMALVLQLGGARTANATAHIAAAMLSDAEAHGFHPACGLASCRFVLQGLALANASAALAMATVPTSPGWAYMSTSDMPGTIWEEWTGDAHTSDGSKNHPMFTGGIGVWLYDDALGLQVRHHVEALGSAHDADCVAALNVDVRSALGFGPAETAVLCRVLHSSAVLQQKRGGGKLVLHELHAMAVHHAAELGVTAALYGAQPAVMVARVSAAPSAAVVRTLGQASGWRHLPAGAVTLDWTWQHAEGLLMRLGVPAGVDAHVGLPLQLLPPGASMLTIRRNAVLVTQVVEVDAAGEVRLGAPSAAPAWLQLLGVVPRHTVLHTGRTTLTGEPMLHVQLLAPGAYDLHVAPAKT